MSAPQQGIQTVVPDPETRWCSETVNETLTTLTVDAFRKRGDVNRTGSSCPAQIGIHVAGKNIQAAENLRGLYHRAYHRRQDHDYGALLAQLSKWLPPAENHLRRDARIRRPRCPGLLPRPPLQPPHHDAALMMSNFSRFEANGHFSFPFRRRRKI